MVGHHASMRTLSDTPEEQFDYQMNLSFKGVWLGSITAAKQMKEGGSIINVSSITATRGSPNNGPYAANKAAINNLTQTLAAELAPNIRVNAIAPGPVPTKFLMEAMKLTDEMLPAVEKQIAVPLGRLGTSEDMALGSASLAPKQSSREIHKMGTPSIAHYGTTIIEAEPPKDVPLNEAPIGGDLKKALRFFEIMAWG